MVKERERERETNIIKVKFIRFQYFILIKTDRNFFWNIYYKNNRHNTQYTFLVYVLVLYNIYFTKI